LIFYDEADQQAAHPEVTALASGAILSNYQRLRIEHVCQRLGLVSISYLWQAEQLPLLERMLSCGMEVILAKVAGVGLGVDLVGKNLRDLMPLLRRLVSPLFRSFIVYQGQ
jgi:diphthine-ammonia ligase